MKARWGVGVAGAALGLFGLFVWMPSLSYHPGRIAQSEAKGLLKATYVAEESYRAEHDTYAPLAALTGISPAGPRYQVEMVSMSKEHFLLRAVARAADPRGLIDRAFHRNVASYPSMAGDTWEIDDQNHLTNTINRLE